MNPLTDIVPSHYRRRAYKIFGAGSLVLGATQLGYATADAGQPTWLTVALAVWVFLGSGLGLTAAANTTPGDDE